MIRLQRRKRVGNRPLGGYKTLAIGRVDMSQVLQHSFQGEVKLYSEKMSEHIATVIVGSLTSTAVDLDNRRTNEGMSASHTHTPRCKNTSNTSWPQLNSSQEQVHVMIQAQVGCSLIATNQKGFIVHEYFILRIHYNNYYV